MNKFPISNHTQVMLFKELHTEAIRFDDLNEGTQSYFRHTTSTLVYMSICLTCTVWQVITASELAYKVRKWLHFAVLFETFLSFISILCSILNPLTPLSCEFVCKTISFSCSVTNIFLIAILGINYLCQLGRMLHSNNLIV